MGYSMDLFLPIDGMTPEESYSHGGKPLTTEERTRLIDLVHTKFNELEMFQQSGHAEFTDSKWGIQIGISENGVAVSFPYADDVEEKYAQLKEYLNLLGQEFEFWVWDPQIEEFYSVVSDETDPDTPQKKFAD